MWPRKKIAVILWWPRLIIELKQCAIVCLLHRYFAPLTVLPRWQYHPFAFFAPITSFPPTFLSHTLFALLSILPHYSFDSQEFPDFLINSFYWNSCNFLLSKNYQNTIFLTASVTKWDWNEFHWFEMEWICSTVIVFEQWKMVHFTFCNFSLLVAI